MIKNEHLYLEEWITHHLNIGFDEIHLYEDAGSKSHKDICDKFNNVYLYQLSDYVSLEGLGENVKRQVALFNYFINTHKDGWCLFIDADEFLQSSKSLDDLTSQYKDCTGFRIYWKIFGANGHIKRPTGSLYQNYKEVLNYDKKEVGCRFKTFVNLNMQCKQFDDNTHFYDKADRTEKEAHLDHFITMSFEDFVERRLKRGCVTKNNRKFLSFFFINKDMISLIPKLRKEYEL